MKKLLLGTRPSKLAISQSRFVVSALKKLQVGLDFEIVEIVTAGDKRKEQGVSDKKEWVLEIEEALLNKEIDFAVHSGKDVPVDIIPDSILFPVLSREDPSDAFIGKLHRTWRELPHRAQIGTSSERRRAQLLRLRPDLEIVDLRGNVPTRIEKLEQSKTLAGIVLASAGINRLSLKAVISSQFSTQEMVPAMNQGILVAQCLKERRDICALLQALSTDALQAVYAAERRCIATLGAHCRSAVGVYGEIVSQRLQLQSRVLSRDGKEICEERVVGDPKNAYLLGDELAELLIAAGAKKLLEVE